MARQFEHEVVKDATLTLAYVLKSEVPKLLSSRTPIETVFDIPDRELVQRAHAEGKIVLSLKLIDVNRSTMPNTTQPTIEREEDENGDICEFTVGPPTYVMPRYLITPWAKDALVDQEVMGAILRLFFHMPSFLPEQIQGKSIPTDQVTQIMLVEAFGLERQMKLWQVIQQPYRPSVVYGVNLRMASLQKTIVRRVRERVLDFKKLEG